MIWQPIETAPKDGTHVLLLTGDFGAVEGWWSATVPDFYDSSEMGDWVSDWQIGAAYNDPKEFRLSCACIPLYWMPLPKRPRPE